jgi:RNA recognition motif-containing protein
MRLYVDNLAYVITEHELRDAFEAHGSVDECRIPKNLRTGIVQGFGYVVMKLDAEANSAIAALNESTLGGKKLAVRESRQQGRGKLQATPVSRAAKSLKPPAPRRKQS